MTAPRRHSPAPGRPSPAPAAADGATSSGWWIEIGGGTHLLELGPPILGWGHPGAIYLDGAVLAQLPILPLGGTWHHDFTLAGAGYTIEARFGRERQGWDWALRPAGEKPRLPEGVPVEASLRPSFRRAARASRRFETVFYLMFGLTSGFLIPIAGSARRGPTFLLLMTIVLAAGAVAIPFAALLRSRGSRAVWIEPVYRVLRPFDLGAIVGLGLATFLQFGSDTDTTDAIMDGVLVVGGIGLVALALFGLWLIASQRRTTDLSVVEQAGCAIGSLGCAPVGIGSVMAALGLYGSSLHEAGPSGYLLFAGMGLGLLSTVIIIVGRARARKHPTRGPGPAV